MTNLVYVANTNLIELHGLKNAATDSLISGASVEFTLKDKSDVAVTGDTFPAAMAAIDGEPGGYRGVLKDTLALTAGQTYKAFVDVDGGADLIAHYELPFSPKTRKDA